MRTRAWSAAAGALLMITGLVPAAGAEDRSDRCEWTQWGASATHTGQSCAPGVGELRLLARMVVDPFAPALDRETGGGVPVHYPVPLIDGDGTVFVLRKGGSFVSCDPPGSGEPAPCGLHRDNLNRMTWSVQALRWRHDRLVPAWRFTSDWKPTQMFSEALFQSALGGDHVFVPGAGGTVFQLDKSTGRVVRRINPFGPGIDPNTFVGGGLTVDGRGRLLYNAITVEPVPNRLPRARGWLVRAGRDGIGKVEYGTLIPSAPRPTDLCYTDFRDASVERPLPPPPQPDGSPTLPPQAPCGAQRAGLNVAPAVGPDGTIFTVTRPHNPGMDYYGHIVALNPDLSLRWATSLRGLFHDGCGILTPYGNGFFDCRPGTAPGVDPFTNLPPAAGVSDSSSASPVALPDGGVVYGSRTLYNGFRGHLVSFDGRGRHRGTDDFGWDITPAVHRHGGSYSLYIKDNHYLAGGPFRVTRLDAGLNRIWSFTNTETRTCERLPDGTISCVDTGEHPNGFEFCISAPAMDRDGNLYGLNADGNLYVVDPAGRQRAKVFLSKTIASAYTPVSLDARGRVYAQNNGELYVLGR
jgi:outer membrane protein assembly factor BamB